LLTARKQENRVKNKTMGIEAHQARLACPNCLAILEASSSGLLCQGCEQKYPFSEHGQADFRPNDSRSISLEYYYEPEFGRFDWSLVKLEWPQNTLPFTPSANWESTELSMIGSVPKTESEKWALDLGCGVDRQRFKEPLEMLGYKLTGVDIEGTAPDVLADLHLLPFQDESFDLLLTSAVFEHVKNPHIAMAEAARVAKEGSLFVGSIAFSEPYHISYFHCSPLAVYELLTSTGFTVESIFLSRKWNVFNAHFEMGYAGARYPGKLKNLIAAAIVRASLLPSAVKSFIQRKPQHLKEHELIFAKSHSAAVGFIATRKRRDNETRIKR
jgi:SAM-dependent methyltransferase